MRYFLLIATLLTSIGVRGETTISVDVSDDLAFTYGFPYGQDAPVTAINFYSDIGETGFYVNIWNASEDFGLFIERDYTLGYIYSFSDKTYIDVSYTLLDFSETGASDDDTFLTALWFSHDITDALNFTAVWEEYEGRVIDSYSGPHWYTELGYTLRLTDSIDITVSGAIGKDRSYESNEKYHRFSFIPRWYINDNLTIRFLGYSTFFPENEPETQVTTYVAFDYTF